MIKRRRFMQYVGLGGVGFMAGVRGRACAAPPSSLQALKSLTFETITVNRHGHERSKSQRFAYYFEEDLGEGALCSLVAIPGGTFRMGTSPTTRTGLHETQSSRRVRVQAFFMGQHLVTQAQWERVAQLPKIDRDLDRNPSYFRGPELPVESVSWLDAMEFCARLASYTERPYRLPSEAEWEYACRAGTTTPFHYGDTVTSQLANYVGTYTYAAESRGNYRQATTPVGSFSPNAFGLYDMHGNVWEWNAGRWLEQTQASRASAREAGTQRDWRALRGGSWSDAPGNIRAATRTGNAVDARNRLFGIRVCCAG